MRRDVSSYFLSLLFKYSAMSSQLQGNFIVFSHTRIFKLFCFTAVYGSQLVEPTCNLPRNFTGNWFTSGEFDTDVIINTTHIYFKTKIDQFTYRETYFTCQQNRDTRFLMTAVTVGKW